MGFDPIERQHVPAATPPVTGVVVRADTSGVWVAPLGEDTRHPFGPCRGAAGVAVGVVVLLIHTDQGPWVAGQVT